MGTVQPRRFPLVSSERTATDRIFNPAQFLKSRKPAAKGIATGAAAPAAPAALPAQVDLRPNFSFYPPQDQGDLNSCTSFAITGAIAYLATNQYKLSLQGLSELFVWYNERVLQGVIDTNSPVDIKNGLITTSKQGSCQANYWPYDAAQYTVEPPPPAYQDALKLINANYEVVAQDAESIKSSLAEGIPVVFGFAVYPYFVSQTMADTGILEMPVPNDFRMGGHAVLMVGYDDATQQFIVRNSFGTNWGLQGYFMMPYDYALNPKYAMDFWRISKLAVNNP